MLKHRNILLGITGGIAAYKIPQLVRSLRRQGANVRIVMTESAKEFVTPVTLSTLSVNEVVVGTFPQSNEPTVDMRTWHIDRALWADVMLIAPATANIIAKLAHGYADDAVSTLALALRSSLVVAPAMDVDMLQHPTSQHNIELLQELGYIVIPPETGELASGLVGPGRLAELDVIEKTLDEVLTYTHHDLKKKKIIVTAGPTHEPIDPVRFIGNRSSGKMGFAIANAAAQRGAEVTLIAGPVSLPTPRNVHRIDVETSRQMFNTVMKHQQRADAIIMAAAVADFVPASYSSEKIKKEQVDKDFPLRLMLTRDILHALGEKKGRKVLVGFALETQNGLKNAKKKLKDKKLDMIVLNNPLEEGAGFGSDTNIVTIISKSGKTEKLTKMSKWNVAHEILNRISRK